MVANPAYIIGENKVVSLQLESTKGEHFVVKEATYKLTLDEVEVLTGDCKIDNEKYVVSCQLEPPDPGFYQLDIKCVIGPETFIFRYGVIVKC
ncbi:hypothetical protein [Holdemania sp. Marseille-P2844]|uniref:hypothetical protein n=1 Tax=Holdemania sp. Marseille-P2844 TaxID=1852366 RepID=UPI0009329887|nr:hypothetical protein [Holdemania sp. Marseille-P2844]